MHVLWPCPFDQRVEFLPLCRSHQILSSVETDPQDLSIVAAACNLRKVGQAAAVDFKQGKRFVRPPSLCLWA